MYKTVNATFMNTRFSIKWFMGILVGRGNSWVNESNAGSCS